MALWAALAALGEADLSAGRLFEGHVNVQRLLRDHGDPVQRARGAAAGLLAIWGADDPAAPARLEGGRLHGRKLFCSGGPAVGAALVTAKGEAGPVLVWLARPDPARFSDGPSWPLLGMAATESRALDLDGMAVGTGDVIGRPGAYLAQPAFSGGIWRILALQYGAMRRLDAALAAHLDALGRAQHPAQRARRRDNALDIETVRLWTREAARRVEAGGEVRGALAHVALAREAVLRAAEGVLARVQRGIGLPAFVEGGPVARPMQDLAAFLRQPGPDAAQELATDTLLEGGFAP